SPPSLSSQVSGADTSTEISASAMPVVAARAIGMSTVAVLSGSIAGTGCVVPSGNETPGVVVATSIAAPVSGAGPGLPTTTRTTPLSSPSSRPSPSQTSPTTSRVISPSARRGLTAKSSTTPTKSGDERGGDTAQRPAPRVANPAAIATASAGSLAAAAARIASRASTKVLSAGARDSPATT